VVCSPVGEVPTDPGGATALCEELAVPRNALGRRLRGAERAVLVWSGPGGGGGARLAELAHELGFEGKDACGAFHLPATANALGAAAAWAASADADEANPEPIKLLLVSGDDAAADPSVRALAEQAEHVIVLTMFHELAAGWADLLLPATAALERDGTSTNLEGRVQRLRRTVLPPCPDELAWIAKLAARFGVKIASQAPGVFEELAERLFRDLSLDGLGLYAPLPARHAYETPAPASTSSSSVLSTFSDEKYVGALRLQRYRPLFSGPAVERVRQLDFQRAHPDVELSAADAERRGIAAGDTVLVRSNGTSVELRAHVNRQLVEGIARIADEHAADLHAAVEVVKA
jgi:predicted molibdopterin-dependent oxidoreductase YjgC